MIKKLIYFLLFFTVNVYSQNDNSLRDSIIKYKYINPSKAIDFGIEFTNEYYDVKPTKITYQTFGLIGEILQSNGLDDLALEYFNQMNMMRKSDTERILKDALDKIEDVSEYILFNYQQLKIK